MEYIIISLKHGKPTQPVFWRPNDAGYTESLHDAGRYAEEEVKGNQSYYNNGLSTVAVPLSHQALSEIGFSCSYDGKALEKFFQKGM